MAIAQVPAGKLISKGKRLQVHDYSHLSPSPDYQLRVHQSTTIPTKHVVEVQIHHKGKQIGEVTGSVGNGTLLMGNAEIFPEHRQEHMGKGLGKAANLALLTHAYQLGAHQVAGSGHTEDSARVYRSLARTHGFDYNAPKTGRLYGNYRYSLKSELLPAAKLVEGLMKNQEFNNV